MFEDLFFCSLAKTSQTLLFQVDVIHLNAIPGNQTVAYGMDLSEYYLNVEWDILRVPAVRHVKKYPCCPEPYPGTVSKIFISQAIHSFFISPLWSL